jgi:hypothetical protein
MSTVEENIKMLESLEHYKLIADEDELKWFYDHCVHPLKRNEAYAFCLSIRKKKLNEEDLKSPLGRVEMLDPQVVFATKDGETTYERWKKGIRSYECHKEAFAYGGHTLPPKAMVVYFHINPCDELKVIEDLKGYINIHEQELINSAIKDIDRANFIANILGPDLSGYLNNPTAESLDAITKRIGSLKMRSDESGTSQSLYKMCKSLSKMKRLQFDNVGTKYWVDFDLDLNDWGKYIRDFYVDGDPLLDSWMDYCNEKLGKGNFVIVATSGGYHTMVNKDIIHWNPNTFIEDFQRLEIDTPMPHPDGSTRLVKNGELIGELVYNTNAMIPVPGTYQYGHVVRVINKGDFPA